MVLTRQGSRYLANGPNIFVMSTTAGSTTGSDTPAAGAATFTTASSTFQTTVVTATNAIPLTAASNPSEPSISSEELNDTMVSPEFASITAQNIRRDFRQDNQGTSRFREETGQGSNIQEIVATIGLAQAQIMRSCEEILQFRQELEQGARYGQPIRPMLNQNRPPPSTTYAGIHQTNDQPIPSVPPPPDFAENATRPIPHSETIFFGPSTNFHQESNSQANPMWNGFSQYQHTSPYYGYPMPPVGPPKVNIKTWGIKFDGTGKTMDAEDFIFRVEALRQDHNYPVADLMKDFQQLLEGDAHDWYWQHRRLSSFRSWPELRDAFLNQFRRFENEFQIQKKIMDRRQQPHESVEDFFNAVIKLRNQQRQPYSEEDLVEIMKGNLKASLAALIFPIRIFGLQQFRYEVKRAENMLASQRQTYQSRTYQSARVNEINYEAQETSMDFEVEAISANNRYTCWNCRKSGHSYVECPIPVSRIFCFKCGKEGVVTPKCSRCQGNLMRSAPRAGETRSTQTDQ